MPSIKQSTGIFQLPAKTIVLELVLLNNNTIPLLTTNYNRTLI